AHRFVEARYLAGDEAAALAAYADFRARLEMAESRAPNLGLRELVKRIESGRPRASTLDQDDDWEQAPDFASALIGRGSPWNAMVEAWTEVAKGGSRIVVVEGEAGIGKSRLAEDFTRWLRTNGASVLRTRPFEAGVAVAFGSVLELLRGALKV